MPFSTVEVTPGAICFTFFAGALLMRVTFRLSLALALCKSLAGVAAMTVSAAEAITLVSKIFFIMIGLYMNKKLQRYE